MPIFRATAHGLRRRSESLARRWRDRSNSTGGGGHAPRHRQTEAATAATDGAGGHLLEQPASRLPGQCHTIHTEMPVGCVDATQHEQRRLLVVWMPRSTDSHLVAVWILHSTDREGS